jgi:ribosomal protein L37AE/L43A
MTDLFQPTPKTDPRVHLCADCRRPNAPCGVNGLWYCAACVHPSFWPKNRGRG